MGEGIGEEMNYTMPLVAIFVIFILSLVGSLFPPLMGVYLPKYDLNGNWVFRLFNGFAAGIVLGIAYIHSLPEAIESFDEGVDGRTDGASKYAWPGFIAMMGSLITFASEQFVHRYVGRFAALHGGHDHDHNHDHDHEHGKEEKSIEIKTMDVEASAGDQSSVSSDPAVSAPDYFTELYVLLFGLSFHSLFVGMAIGVASKDWGLFAAVVFHQLFEGMALGARVARATFERRLHIWLLDLTFALAAPIGIAIGLGIHSNLLHDASKYYIANACFQAMSAGILLYVALIHMMKEEMERPEFKNGGKLMWAMYVGFMLGAGIMAVIGIWA